MFKLLCLLSVFGIFLHSSECSIFKIATNDDTKEWWQTTIFYQIYPRSFKDSDGDGIGDLKGVTSKLQYLKDVGIGATWLSPIFQSPMNDFGYDISDFKKIHSEYGTMADFDAMMVEAKRLGIKIIMDFVPNHSSDQHEWFEKSVKKEGKYTDYYVWHNGKPNPAGGQNLPPNNWVSVFRDSAWEWNEERGQYYLHQFLIEQPDLNYNNADLVQEMKDVLTFWLDKGVDGFRVDAIIHMFEDDGYPDEPLSGYTNDPDDYSYLKHDYTVHYPGTYDMVYSWRKLMDDYKTSKGGDTRVMMVEAYANMTDTMRYYENEGKTKFGAHMPFNFLLITDLSAQSNANDFEKTINKWMTNMPADQTANWVMGNHDRPRVGTRYGADLIDALNMLVLTLPGIAVTYMGDEIGMVDHTGITWEQTRDPPALKTNESVYMIYSRDPCRTPFQWDATTSSGFSSNAVTWLPVNPNYRTLNVAAQLDKDKSHLEIYKKLTELRKTNTIVNGDFKLKVLSSTAFAYVRVLEKSDTYVVVINLDDKTAKIDLKTFGSLIPANITVEITQAGSKLEEGSSIATNNFDLGKYEAVVLKAKYDDSDAATSIIFSPLLLMLTILVLLKVY